MSGKCLVCGAFSTLSQEAKASKHPTGFARTIPELRLLYFLDAGSQVDTLKRKIHLIFIDYPKVIEVTFSIQNRWDLEKEILLCLLSDS